MAGNVKYSWLVIDILIYLSKETLFKIFKTFQVMQKCNVLSSALWPSKYLSQKIICGRIFDDRQNGDAFVFYCVHVYASWTGRVQERVISMLFSMP